MTGFGADKTMTAVLSGSADIGFMGSEASIYTFNEGAKKQALVTKINQEKTFRERLEKKQTKTTYEIALDLVDDEIDVLNKKKASFNLNETLEEDLEQLNIIKDRRISEGFRTKYFAYRFATIKIVI